MENKMNSMTYKNNFRKIKRNQYRRWLSRIEQ